MNKTIELAQDLIRRQSITPNDAGCQMLLAERLVALGFSAKHLRFSEVDNLWLSRGQGEPVFTFVGHTDVVPTGPLAEWHTPPFAAEIRDGYLYGRGAADMKGSVAAFVTAVERFIANTPDYQGTIALLLTSDEEGDAIHGTRKVVDYLQQHNIQIKWCLVGEPSSQHKLGDIVKNGRRGSLNGRLTVHGKQGHVAYPKLADNPVHRIMPALNELCNKHWDSGSASYPPTGFQISNIHAGTGADNVIPGTLEVVFNYRFSTAVSEQDLITGSEMILNKYGMNYQLDWRLSGQPFLTSDGALLDAVQYSINETLGYTGELSTAGGTSDGRFIAPTGAEVIELGPINTTIHQINECVRTDDLTSLSTIYQSVLNKLLI